MQIKLDSVQVRSKYWPRCLTESADLVRHCLTSWHAGMALCALQHPVADVQCGPELTSHLLLLPITPLQYACPARVSQLRQPIPMLHAVTKLAHPQLADLHLVAARQRCREMP